MGLLEIFQLSLVACFVVLNFGGVGEARSSLSKEEDLELERQLKILNKPPRKTIKDASGTLFDCIDIHKQPALDHPLLKNHKIQMEPPPLFDHQETNNEAIPPFIKRVEIGIKGEGCPPGTVIIQRTRKEDLLWARDHFNTQQMPYYHWNHSNTQNNPGIHFGVATVQAPRQYNGVAGCINIYRPKVKPTQFSASQMWIDYRSPTEVNSIQFGWMVNPKLFGDDQSRMFGFWTADPDHKTGCFNMLCSGFAQVHPNVTFGMLLEADEPGSSIQHLLELKVAKHPQSGDWWLYGGGRCEPIGYWPKPLFTGLADHAATTVFWGGQVSGPINDSPPMGSGQWAKRHLPYAGMVSNMRVVDEKYETVDVDDKAVQKVSTSPQCYTVIYRGYRGTGLRRLMYFGGPGGNNCGP